MNFGALFRAFDAVMAFRDAARRVTGGTSSDSSLAQQSSAAAVGGQIEARLTNVVVAALKEAFDRDHARLELERAQLEEERRRADALLRVELQRQAADREVGRLRLIGGTALVGWIASVLGLGLRLANTSVPSRIMVAGGWVLLLAALASAFSAQGRMSGYIPDGKNPLPGSSISTASLWLLIAGLAVTAMSLLF